MKNPKSPASNRTMGMPTPRPTPRAIDVVEEADVVEVPVTVEALTVVGVDVEVLVAPVIVTDILVDTVLVVLVAAEMEELGVAPGPSFAGKTVGTAVWYASSW